MGPFQKLITFQQPTCKWQQKYFLLISWLSELHFKLMIFSILLFMSLEFQGRKIPACNTSSLSSPPPPSVNPRQDKSITGEVIGRICLLIGNQFSPRLVNSICITEESFFYYYLQIKPGNPSFSGYQVFLFTSQHLGHVQKNRAPPGGSRCCHGNPVCLVLNFLV